MAGQSLVADWSWATTSHMLNTEECIVLSVTWVKTDSCQPLNKGDVTEKASLLRFHLCFGCYHSILILAFHIVSWKLLPFYPYFSLNYRAKKKKKKKIKPTQSILWGKLLWNKDFPYLFALIYKMSEFRIQWPHSWSTHFFPWVSSGAINHGWTMGWGWHGNAEAALGPLPWW